VPEEAWLAKSEFGETPWHEAIVSHNCDLVAFLMERIVTIDARTETGHTALHLACQEGDEAIAWMLLEGGADVNALDWHGMSALHCAVEKADGLLVAMLLGKRAFVGYDDEVTTSPWMRACELGHWEVAEMLEAVSDAEELVAINPYGLHACI
jgi:ankyrin repeat protein